MYHHVITLLLQTGSYLLNFQGVGALIVYVMDSSDVLGAFGRSMF